MLSTKPRCPILVRLRAHPSGRELARQIARNATDSSITPQDVDPEPRGSATLRLMRPISRRRERTGELPALLAAEIEAPR